MRFNYIIFTAFLSFSTQSLAFPTILAIGDSLTEGFQLSENEAYPHQLELILKNKGYEQAKVINGGISGATTAIGLNTLKFHLKNKKYDLIIFCLGANDGLRGQPVENTKKNIEKAIDFAKEKKVHFILVGMQVPPNYGKKYTENFKRIYPEISKKHNVSLIPFLLKGVAAKKELNLPDGIHPNANGYKIIADTVAKKTIQVLKTIK